MRFFCLLVAVIALSLPPSLHAAGLQTASLRDPAGERIELAIWYPSTQPAQDVPMGPFTPHVAMAAPISGQNLPLVVLSHGTGGANMNHFDTAAALADAGFVVAALMHPGDNYQDSASAFTAANFSNRPQHIHAVIDYMLHDWPGHAALNPARIGMLGHSAGGTTALLIAGGMLDWQRVIGFCSTNTQDWACSKANARHIGPVMPTAAISFADPRVKAIVIAAPALSHGFVPNGLAGVHVPVQLWVGGQDDVVTDAAQLSTLLHPAPEGHLIAQAGHFAYLATCSPWLASIASEICRDPPGFDRAAFLLRFQHDVIGFFRAKL